jgi:hypothetical protein
LTYPDVADDWLDFSQPDARAFLADVVEEIATGYDVDGVILDYTRWREQWYQAAGLSAVDITLTVQGIHERLQATRTVPLAVAADGDQDYAETWRGQRWVEWLDLDYIDHVAAMSYHHDDWLRSRLTEWRNTGHFPERIIPLLSAAWFDWNAGHSREEPKTVSEVLHQIEICDTMGAYGLALWDDRYICSKNPELMSALGSGGW